MIDFEVSLIGSIFQNPKAAIQVAGEIKPHHFGGSVNAKIYRAILSLVTSGLDVDQIAVINHEDNCREVAAAVWGIDDTVINPGAWKTYAAGVLQSHRLREIERALETSLRAVRRSQVDEVEDTAASVASSVLEACTPQEDSRVVSVQEATKSALAEFRAAADPNLTETGVKTGFRELDEIVGVMKPGEMYVLAGRPGMGKSTLALNIAAHVSKTQPTLVASLEMSATQIGGKIIAAEGRVSWSRLNRGTASAAMVENAIHARGVIDEFKLSILDDSQVSPEDILARGRQVSAIHGSIGLVVVDYLQLMGSGGKSENRVQEVSKISRSLKVIARELGCPVIAVAQLNRGVESREDKRPMLSDLRDSGAIEQDADQVWFVYRESYYTGGDDPRSEIIIAKNRRDRRGTVTLAFDGDQSRFDEHVEKWGQQWSA